VPVCGAVESEEAVSTYYGKWGGGVMERWTQHGSENRVDLTEKLTNALNERDILREHLRLLLGKTGLVIEAWNETEELEGPMSGLDLAARQIAAYLAGER
jgi:hypothetical protein